MLVDLRPTIESLFARVGPKAPWTHGDKRKLIHSVLLLLKRTRAKDCIKTIPALSERTLNLTTPSVWRAKCVEWARARLQQDSPASLGGIIIVILRSCLPLLSPNYANPTLRGLEGS